MSPPWVTLLSSRSQAQGCPLPPLTPPLTGSCAGPGPRPPRGPTLPSLGASAPARGRARSQPPSLRTPTPTRGVAGCLRPPRKPACETGGDHAKPDALRSVGAQKQLLSFLGASSRTPNTVQQQVSDFGTPASTPGTPILSPCRPQGPQRPSTLMCPSRPHTLHLGLVG